MKAKIFLAGLLFAVFFFYSSSYSQVPQMINYQGRLTDTTGAAIDTTVSMSFAIYTDSVGADSVWSETQDPVIVEDGTFNVLLGSVTPIPFDVFNGDIRYLGVQVGEDEEMTPRREIVSVAYAYRAQMGDNDWTFRITDGGDTTLITGGEWGIARSGNVLHGNADSTHVNLGVACTTGTSGQNYKCCTVGGGLRNTASYRAATVGGGALNTASGLGSTVGGGGSNTASGMNSAVGGGAGNTASGDFSTVCGGVENLVEGFSSAILGGLADTITATANYSYLFGIDSKLTEDSTFMVDMPHIWFGDETDGFEFPTSDGASGQIMATDGSGQLSWVDVSGGGGGWVDEGTFVRLETTTDSVGIGRSPNEKLDVEGNIHASGSIKSGNSLELDGPNDRLITTSGEMYFGRAPGNFDDVKVGIGTTSPNAALQVNGAISRQNTVLYGDNDSTHVNLGVACTTGTSGQNYKYCTVGGGFANTASGDSATVGGGGNNTANGHGATIGGGVSNAATENYATVGGGWSNTANEILATVAGGWSNTANEILATVGGGGGNTASGLAATVPGGSANTADGYFSFAAGGGVTVTADAENTFAFGLNFTTSAPHAVIFHNSEVDISVGIGTTSPEAMLHVAGTIQGEEAFFFDEDANVADIWDAVIGFSYPQGTPFDRRLRITAGRDDGQDVGNSQGACIDLHGNNWPFGDKNGDLDLVAGEGIPGARGDIIFWTGEDGAQPRMVIDTLGNVGIGTATPDYRLVVEDQGNGGIEIHRAGTGAGLRFNMVNDGRNWQLYHAGGPFSIEDVTAGEKRLTIDTDGNVGIGTTNPQRALHISDVLRLEPRTSAPSNPSEGDIYVNSTNHHIYCYLNGAWKRLD